MWYKNNYRRIFMDMHISDDKPDVYLSKLDMDDLISTVKAAGAECIVVKGKSHVGLNYFKGPIGRMHEGLKRRNIDYLGEMTEKCHAAGLAVMTYLSQNFDNYAYDNHPEWRIVDINGNSSRDINGEGLERDRYGIVCLNNKKYQKYVHDILSSMVSDYDFDGIFLDMPFWHTVCYCDSCKDKYREETGLEMPKKEDWKDPEWIKFVEIRSKWLRDFMYANTKAVKDIRPSVSVEHNMSSISGHWLLACDERLFGASDYAGADFYGGYAEQSFMCKYFNNMTTNKPFCYITSRCEPNLYFHTVSRTEHDLLIHGINSLIHNGGFSICDAMNPDGTINNKLYQESIKNVFAATAPYEKYVSGDIISDAAIVYFTEIKGNPNYAASPMNIGKLLREYNVPYDVISAKNIKDMDEKVLCVNDPFYISDEEYSYIESYVRRGGNLFITGNLPSKKLEELCGVKIIKQSDWNYSYLRPAEKYAELFEPFDEASPYPVQRPAWETEIADDSAEILAYLTYPYTKPGEKSFAAIHSDPPGINTKLPAVIRRSYGKGSIIWVACPAELTVGCDCRKVLYRLISSLIDKPSYTAHAPEFVEILHWQKDGKKYFSAVNQQQITPVYPISKITITVPYHAENISLLTPSASDDNIAIAVDYNGGETTIHLPELNVFHIIEISD